MKYEVGLTLRANGHGAHGGIDMSHVVTCDILRLLRLIRVRVREKEEWHMHIVQSSWLELVGEDGEVATAKIKQEKPDVHAIVNPEGTIITQELRCNRVRVWVDENGVITAVPHVG
ncbi:unnamed protein product [Prunus armeniaca]